MDFRLIKASIALFQGKRSETQRLLQDYLADQPDDAKRIPMVMWLDAQSQPDRDERLKRLNTLVAEGDPNSVYTRLTADYLHQEEEYTGLLNPGSTSRSRGISVLGVPLWKMLVFLVAGGIITFIGVSALNLGGTAPTLALDTTTTPGTPGTLENTFILGTASPDLTLEATLGITFTPVPTITSTPLPDRSQIVDPTRRQATYNGHTLQITRIEYDSERVLEKGQAALSTPVSGAIFYALKLRFTCGAGVCYEPPEAELSLVLIDGTHIPLMENAGIAGEALMVSVADGQVTEGWVIFEVPVIVAADQLEVLVPSEPGQPTPEPLLISATTQ